MLGIYGQTVKSPATRVNWKSPPKRRKKQCLYRWARKHQRAEPIAYAGPASPFPLTCSRSALACAPREVSARIPNPSKVIYGMHS
jgi:hypothetical protein